MKYRVLDAEIGQVIYQRMSGGVVMAARVKGFVFGGEGTAPHESSYINLQYPTGETEKIYIGIGSDRKFYPSIEDCIEGVNVIDYFYIKIEDLAFLCGIKYFCTHTSFGMQYYAVKKWKWDGYKAVEVDVSISANYIFIKDENGLHYTRRQSKTETTKYYDTKEECIADNFVKVVTF